MDLTKLTYKELGLLEASIYMERMRRYNNELDEIASNMDLEDCTELK